MRATYTKLRDESWGIRVEDGFPEPGSIIEVRKQSGEVKDEVVKAVIWKGRDRDSGKQISLCSIERREKESSAGVHNAIPTQLCAECHERQGVVMAADSSGIRALCCRRCANMEAHERSFM